MAWDGQQLKIPGLTAAADYTAVGNQYKFVYLNAAKTVTVCSGNTQVPIGVLQNRPYTGEAAEVVALGLTKVQGDVDLAFGAFVGTSADGQAATYSASDTTKCIVGVVVEDNLAAAGLATVLLYGPGRKLA